MEIGFIGLGNLGNIMVDNLLEKGRHMHLYNRSAEKLQPFHGRATIHENVGALAAAVDVVVSIVSDDKAVLAISLGEDGIVRHLKPGGLHLCLSTISPDVATQLQTAHAGQGSEYLTATIVGRPEAARARSLIICLSGKTSRQQQIEDLLSDLGGKSVYSFGEDARTAAVVKICNNFLIIAAVEAMGEAFNLAKKAGADPEAFYSMITETIFNAPIYKNYGRIIIDEKFEQAAFTAQLGLKDTRLALQLADQTSTPMPMADLIRNRFLVNQNMGRNNYDWTAIAKLIGEENGPPVEKQDA